MPYLFELENRRIGRKIGNKYATYPGIQLPLLESIRCHSTDEYLIYGIEEENPVPPLACSFSRVPSSAHLLALVDENGSLVIYNTNRYGEDALLKDWKAHSNAVFDLAWMSKEDKILTGSGDQTICLWDATTAKKLLTFKGHTSSVRSVTFRTQDDAVFASGSRDGHVRLWDHRFNIKDDQVSSINVIKNAHALPVQPGNKRRKSRACPTQPLDSQQSVTSVVFQDENLLATAGAVDGVIKVWDLRKISNKNTTTDPVALYNFPYAGKSKRTHGYSSLVFDSSRSRLFASCTDDIIYMYDFASYNTAPVCVYRGHRNTSFYVKAVISPDDQYLLSGSSDEHAYLWQIDKPNQSPVILKGHRSEVSDVAWCRKDLFRIVTASDDNTMRIWRFDPTVALRKASGKSDGAYGITGTAERTHRDIGTGVSSSQGSSQNSQSAARSPVPGQKRASPETPPPHYTPKRAKSFPSSSTKVSPSIKHWLKRSASDSVTTEENKAKLPKLSEASSENELPDIKEESEMDLVKTSVSEKLKRTASDSVTTEENKAKLSKFSEDPSENVGNKLSGIKEESSADLVKTCVSEKLNRDSFIGKQSCKRKLVDDNENVENERPKKRLNQYRSSGKENNKESFHKTTPSAKQTSKDSVSNNGNERLESVSESETGSVKDSPRKKNTALKNLGSDINASPDKKVQEGHIEFYSPARIRSLDLDVNKLASPTSNLPNLVLDSPVSSRKVTNKENEENKKSKVDWLTQMRMQKLGKQSSGARSCSKKLADKYSQSKASEAQNKEDKQQTQGNLEDLLRCKSPVSGMKSIKSFFKSQSADCS